MICDALIAHIYIAAICVLRGEEYAYRHHAFCVMWMADWLLCTATDICPRYRRFRKRQDDISDCLHPEFLQYTSHASIWDRTGTAKMSSVEVDILSDTSSLQAEPADFHERPWAGRGITLHQ